MLEIQVGLVGGGQMARALARGLVDKQLLKAEQISVHDPSPEAMKQIQGAVPGIRVVRENAQLSGQADLVVLAVKPQVFAQVAASLNVPRAPQTLVVSVLAGVSLARLQDHLGTDRVVRVMPNTPCLVGRGASAYCLAEGASEEDGQLVEQLLSSVGIAFRLGESLLDAVTGLSGSGPAFVLTMIEAMSDGGVRMGLPRDVATQLAIQTFLGSAVMASSSGEHLAVLKDRVTSPGGTTIAGLQEMEEHGVRAALISAVQAATMRAIELGQES